MESNTEILRLVLRLILRLYTSPAIHTWGHGIYGPLAIQTLGKTDMYGVLPVRACSIRQNGVPTCGYEHVKTSISGSPIYRYAWCIARVWCDAAVRSPSCLTHHHAGSNRLPTGGLASLISKLLRSEISGIQDSRLISGISQSYISVISQLYLRYTLFSASGPCN